MLLLLFEIVRDFNKQARGKNLNAFAASTAYFLFLSIVPILILICSIIPYTPLTEENLIGALTDIFPSAIESLVRSVVAEVYGQSIGILSLAALTTLWSAGKGVLALMRGLNAINDVEEGRNYLVVRVLSSVYTIIVLAAMILSLILMVFGNRLVNLLLNDIPQVRVLISFLMNFRFMAV